MLFPNCGITYRNVLPFSAQSCSLGRQTAMFQGEPGMRSQVQPLEPAACNTLMALSKVLSPLEEEGRLHSPERTHVMTEPSHLTLTITLHVQVRCNDPGGSLRRSCFACCCSSGYNGSSPHKQSTHRWHLGTDLSKVTKSP